MEQYKGFPYPIVKSIGGFFKHSSGVDQIKADLLILLLTTPGERIFLPNFGTPLKDLIFDPNDATLEERARQMIIDSVTQWEPRIVVDQIEVSSIVPKSYLSDDDDQTETKSILTITIHFRDPGNITDNQQLVLDIPLK